MKDITVSRPLKIMAGVTCTDPIPGVQERSEKNLPNGYAGLDSSGQIPSIQLSNAKIDPSSSWWLYDDFMGNAYNNRLWATAMSGTGTISKNSSYPSCVMIRCGASSGNYTTLWTTYGEALFSKACALRVGVQLIHVIDCIVSVGLYISDSNRIEWRTDPATNRWTCVTTSAGVSTVTQTSKTLDLVLRHLSIRCVPAYGIVSFLFNGEQQTTHALNIPSVGLALRANIARTAGTATRDVAVDYIEASGSK